MATRHTRQTLASDLTALGVEAGDTLFIHSSFKSLGPVEGGAGAIISAMEDAVGPDGLILMPSFNMTFPFTERDRRAEVWDLATTPSAVGWLTEHFRKMPGTHRSDHHSHSVAARGNGAAEFVDGHRSREGHSSPWETGTSGKAFGLNSPMCRAYESDGKLLMLGTTYDSSTYIHFTEVLYWSRLKERGLDVVYPFLERPVVGDFWERNRKPDVAKVGDADCRLFGIREYVHGILAELDENPLPYLRLWLDPA